MTDERQAPTVVPVVDLEAGVVFIPISTEFLPLMVDRWLVCARIRMSARSDGVYDLEIEAARP